MAEYEVNVELEQETDIEISFNDLSDSEKLILIDAIINNLSYTFEDQWVYLEGETTVNIEPGDHR